MVDTREPRELLESYSIRLADADNDQVQDVAKRDGLKWSEAVRRMLDYAAQHMPEGWHR